MNSEIARVLAAALTCGEFDPGQLAEQAELDPHYIHSALTRYRDFFEVLPKKEIDSGGVGPILRAKAERQAELRDLIATVIGSSAPNAIRESVASSIPPSLVAAEDALLDLGFPRLEKREQMHRIGIAHATSERLKERQDTRDRPPSALSLRLAWLTSLVEFCRAESDAEFHLKDELMENIVEALPGDRARAILGRLATSSMWANQSEFFERAGRTATITRQDLTTRLDALAGRAPRDLAILLTELLSGVVSTGLPKGADSRREIVLAFRRGDARLQTAMRDALVEILSRWRIGSSLELSVVSELCAETGTLGAIRFFRALAQEQNLRSQRPLLLDAIARFAPAREARESLEDAWTDPSLTPSERIRLFEALCRCEPGAYPQWIPGFLGAVDLLRTEAEIGSAVQQAIRAIGTSTVLRGIFDVPHWARSRFAALLGRHAVEQFGVTLSAEELSPAAKSSKLSRQHEIYAVQCSYFEGGAPAEKWMARLERLALN